MSLRYRNVSGQETIIAGLTPGGTIEAGAVATRTGTYNLSGTNWVKQNIVFDSPMPDADYEIITEEHYCAGFTSGQFLIENKTVNGFTIGVYFTSTTASSNIYTGTWKAVKTYTVQHDIQNTEAIAAIQAAIPAGAGTANQLTTKSYVDNADNALSNRVADVEDVIPSTATITNHLVTVDDLQNIEINVDDELSSTSTNPVQNKIVKEAIDTKQDKVFVGTLAQWNALAPSQAAKYQLVNITDDYETGNEHNFLTTEQKTGDKWIDGKDIWKISFVQNNPYTTTKPSTNAEISVTTDLTSCNIDKIIKWNAITTWSDTNSNTPQYYFPTDVTVAGDLSTSGTVTNNGNYTRQYYSISGKKIYFAKNGRYYNYGIQTYNTIYYTKA